MKFSKQQINNKKIYLYLYNYYILYRYGITNKTHLIRILKQLINK